MKKFRLPLISLLFFLVASVFIAINPSFHFFIPAQQVELSHGVQYGAVLKDFLFVQEISMKQRYLSRVDVYIAKLPSQYNNSNVFLLIDDQKRILFTKRFSSADFGEALHFPFDFGKTFDIGKGRMVYACIYSTDGDPQSYIGLARKENGRIGKLYVMPVLNNDVLQSFQNRQSVVDFKGTLGIRTYESDSRFFSTLQIVLYIIAFLISLLIFAGEKVVSLIPRIRIRPEYAFGVVSLGFGMIFLIITPPFQVPDEPAHFYRSYQVASFDFFKLKDDIPASLVKMSDSCGRMQFSTHEKTSFREILSLAQVQTDPTDRVTAVSPNYVIPYVPQAFGILIGKLFDLNPLWLLYLGRFFNLLASLFLVFLAIRVTPVFKWVFTLLGILPMTLYQFASLSYDAGTIGLSFLLLAWILKLSFDESTRVNTRAILWLFVISVLIAASKPPYFLITLAFLIIPVVKFGSLKRYILIFSSLLIVSLLVSQLWKPTRAIVDKITNAPPQKEIQYAGFIPSDLFGDHPSKSHNPLAEALPMLPHAPQNEGVPAQQQDQKSGSAASDGQDSSNVSTQPAFQTVPNPFKPAEQISFILGNPFQYLGILYETILKSGNLYVVSLIGLFGWIDTQVPDGLAYMYLLVLVLLSLLSPEPGIRMGIVKKLVLSAIFLLTFVLIETALYLYCNPVGSPTIIAVQGRYFIAISPLLFLIFYNHQVTDRIREWAGEKSDHKKSRKVVRKSSQSASPEVESLLVKVFPLVALLFATIVLVWSVFLVLDRFYVLSQ